MVFGRREGGGGVYRFSIQAGKNSSYGEVDGNWVVFWGSEIEFLGGGGEGENEGVHRWVEHVKNEDLVHWTWTNELTIERWLRGHYDSWIATKDVSLHRVSECARLSI